jgi:hypothetical protein
MKNEKTKLYFNNKLKINMLYLKTWKCPYKKSEKK